MSRDLMDPDAVVKSRQNGKIDVKDLEKYTVLTGSQQLYSKPSLNHLVEACVEHELEKVRDELLDLADGTEKDRYKENLAEALTYRIENFKSVNLINEVNDQ